jgi:UDP-N-acetylglucosamine 2-epimerase (non-hydrolysing)
MITVVYGTRPEAIKLWSVVKSLRARNASMRVICTGQHRELLDGFDLQPDVSLGLMKPDQEPSDFVARAMLALDEHLKNASHVVVQGDTATAFAATMTAFHRQIPVAHVEAGLRTYRLDSPFPEEGYRQMIDRLSSRLYAPTPDAAENLHREERFYPNSVPPTLLMTGNTGIDAALSVPLEGTVPMKWDGEPLTLGRGEFALVTVHRREAFGERLEAIVRAVKRLSEHIQVIWPVHPNPNVHEVVTRGLANQANVHLVDPLPYPALIGTLRCARFVITDSGGIQEEAPTFGIPAIVVREVTERPEAIKAGASLLVGFDEEKIVRHAKWLCKNSDFYQKMTVPRQLYGDGHAGERIAKDLLEAS